MRKRLPDILIAAALLALPLIYFAPATLGGRTLLPVDNLFTFEPWASHAGESGVALPPHNALINDLLLQHYAWQKFINTSLEQGQLPLWNPHLFAGAPFYAAGLHSATYPFSLIFRVLPLPLAYGWFAVSQLWLAGVFMYLLMRGLRAGRGGGAVAAVVYQLCGFYVTSATFPSIIAAAAWLPLILLTSESIIRSLTCEEERGRALPWMAIGAAALGMAALAGHPEALMYIVVVTAFYGIVRLIMLAWHARRLRVVVIPLLALMVMGGLGLVLGGVQLAPMIEAVRGNFREGAAGLDQVRGWALPWRRVIAFFMPNFFGSPVYHSYYDVFTGQTLPATVNALDRPIDTIDWGMKNYVEGAAYLGVLTLALAVIGAAAPLLARRDAARRAPTSAYSIIFVLLAVLSLAFMFGTPAYALVYYGIPGAGQLHTPFRWIWPFSLSAAVLAGLGADAIRRMWAARAAAPAFEREAWGKGGTPDEALWRLLRWGERALLALGALAFLLLALTRVLFDSVEPLFDRLLHSLARAETAFADARMFYSFEFRQAFVLAVFLTGAGVVMRLARGERVIYGVPAWKPLAVGLIAADLLVASWGFYPANDPALLDYTPPAAEFLAAQDGAWRMTTYEAPGANTFAVNAPWFSGLEDVRGYDSIIQGQYTRYMALIYPQVQLDFNRVAPIYTDQAHALDSPLLDLLGVRYVVAESTIANPRYTKVYSDGAVSVYENAGAMPRAFTLPRDAYLCVTAPQGESAAFAAAVGSFDVRTHAIFTDGDMPPGACWPDKLNGWGSGAPGPAAVTARDINTVWVDVAVREPVYLILADSYYPGWKAFVRPQGTGEDAEQQVEIERVDGNFRAVYLDAPGAWTVRFRFTPDSVKLGAFATFLALVVIVFGLAVWAWRFFYGRHGGVREAGDATGVITAARNSLAPMVLQLFNKAIDFGFAFITLRILEPEGAGKYYYAVVIFVWFDILTNFGLNTYLMREVARDRERANRCLYNTTLLRLGLAALGVPALALFILARQTLASPPLAADTIIAIILLYVALIPTSLSTGLTALFYAFEKAEYPAAISTVATMVKATLGILVLVLGYGIIGLAGASVATSLLTLALLSYLARRFFFRPRREPDRALRREMLREGWPLMLSHLLATVFFKVDVLLLEVMRDNATVGRYSTAYKWLDTINVIPAFLTMGLFPMLSRQAKEDVPALRRTYGLTIKLLVMVALPVAVLTTATADALVNLLGGSAYLPDGAIALQIMIWSIPVGWINSVTNYVLIAFDRQRLLVRAFVVAVSFNLVANLVFMPAHGYRAAAVITILSEVVLLAAVYYHLRPVMGRIPWFLMLWRPVVAAALMGGAMAMLWAVDAPVTGALAVGCVVYAGALLALRPLTAEEMGMLAPLLPEKVRARLFEKNQTANRHE
ncbi:MAG: flippase [Anaerolineae bacterium]|nr:flippase [Anaerolineae bacterium]